MSEISNDEIIQRLTVLEKTNKSLRRMMTWERLCVGVLLAVLGVAGWKHHLNHDLPDSNKGKVVYAAGFVAVDEDGHERVQIGGTGTPGIRISSKDKKGLVNLRVDDERGSAELWLDSTNQLFAGIKMAVSSSGSATLHLSGSEMGDGIFADVTNSHPSLIVSDSTLGSVFVGGGCPETIQAITKSVFSVVPGFERTPQIVDSLKNYVAEHGISPMSITVRESKGELVWDALGRGQERGKGTNAISDNTKDASTKTIKAGRFEVVDSDGKMRASLGIIDNKSSLILFDANGKARASVIDSDLGGVLGLFSHTGEALCLLGKGPNDALSGGFLDLFNADGKPGASLSDKGMVVFSDEKIRAVYGFAKGAGPNIAMYDKQGLQKVGLGYTDEHGSMLLLSDKDKGAHLSLKVDGEHGSMLLLSDKENGARIWLHVNELRPHIELIDDNKVTRVAIGASGMTNKETKIDYYTEPSTIALFSKDGQCVTKLPLSLTP